MLIDFYNLDILIDILMDILREHISTNTQGKYQLALIDW